MRPSTFTERRRIYLLARVLVARRSRRAARRRALSPPRAVVLGAAAAARLRAGRVTDLPGGPRRAPHGRRRRVAHAGRRFRCATSRDSSATATARISRASSLHAMGSLRRAFASVNASFSALQSAGSVAAGCVAEAVFIHRERLVRRGCLRVRQVNAHDRAAARGRARGDRAAGGARTTCPSTIARPSPEPGRPRASAPGRSDRRCAADRSARSPARGRAP